MLNKASQLLAPTFSSTSWEEGKFAYFMKCQTIPLSSRGLNCSVTLFWPGVGVRSAASPPAAQDVATSILTVPPSTCRTTTQIAAPATSTRHRPPTPNSLSDPLTSPFPPTRHHSPPLFHLIHLWPAPRFPQQDPRRQHGLRSFQTTDWTEDWSDELLFLVKPGRAPWLHASALFVSVNTAGKIHHLPWSSSSSRGESRGQMDNSALLCSPLASC